MNPNVRTHMVTAIAFIVFFFLSISVLRQSWADYAFILLVIFIAGASLLIAKNKLWTIVFLAGSQIPLRTPGVLLERFTPAILIIFAVSALFIAQICIRHVGVPTRSSTSKVMLFVAIAITLRLIADPPSSGRISGTGGAYFAVMYFFGVWAFFSSHWTVQFAPDSRRFLKNVFILVGLTFIWKMVSNTWTVENLYHRRMWILAPIALSFFMMRSAERGRSMKAFYLAALTVMGFCLVNNHRSRIFMGMATILAVAYVYRRFKRTAVVMGLAGMLGVALLLATGHVPEVMRRALSTILPTYSSVEAGHMGWRDDFRAENYRLAWEDIKNSPVWGKGFAFDVRTVVDMLQSQSASASEELSELGAHHNGYLSLAVNIGIIVPTLYVIVIFGLVYTAARFARDKLEGHDKMLMAFLVAYFPNLFAQWFMNGAANEFMVQTVLLGVMMGYLYRFGWRPAEERKAMPVRRFARISAQGAQVAIKTVEP